jgi:hypothetical protein
MFRLLIVRADDSTEYHTTPYRVRIIFSLFPKMNRYINYSVVWSGDRLIDLISFLLNCMPYSTHRLIAGS